MDKKLKWLHENAIRLVEGGSAWVDGHQVRAIKAPTFWFGCDICEMGCLCHRDGDSDMVDLCEEVDSVGKNRFYLELVEAK